MFLYTFITDCIVRRLIPIYVYITARQRVTVYALGN